MDILQQPAGESPQSGSGQPQGLEGKDQFLNHASSLLRPFSTRWGLRWAGIPPGTQAEEAGSLELCAEKTYK